MPSLNFTVFKTKIMCGEKTQTIRKLRRHPFKEGDKLFLFWHLRQADCEKLGEAICTQAYPISISIANDKLCVIILPKALGNPWRLSQQQLLELAVADGFSSVEEMQNWFMSKQYLGDGDGEIFQVIHWKLLPCSDKNLNLFRVV